MYTTKDCSIPITPIEKDIIIGSTLGDANIQPSRNNRATASIRCRHSSKQSALCDFKAKALHRHLNRPSYFGISKRKTGPYQYREFYTKYTVELHALRMRFYPQGTKVVPKDIADDLNARSLAMWYMDDGGIETIRNKRNGKIHYISNAIKLHTNGFTKRDVETLRDAIKQRFQISFRLKTADRKKHYVLYTKSRLQIEKFIAIISPFIIPEMRYKLATSYAKRMKRFHTPQSLLHIARKLNLRGWGDCKRYRRGKVIYDSIRLHFGSIELFRANL